MRRTRTVAAILLLAIRADAQPEPSDLVRAGRALAASRLEEAGPLIEQLERSRPDDPRVLGLSAELRLQRGDLSEAAALVRRAVAALPDDEPIAAISARIEAAARVTKGFTESRGGGLVVRHPPGRDSVLVPYVRETLEAQARAVALDLGDRPAFPVVVEILPDGHSLSAITGLPLADIERTGTIAVSKWGRLFVVSPRALARGYPWLDTLAHEWVHLIVTRRTDDRAPIWLQEGIAKFEERRWRDLPGGRLEPVLGALLDRAIAADRLLPFARFHPSIAKLGSQEEAGLAFAEAFTFVRFLHERVGFEGLRDLLERVRSGRDATDAVADVVRAPWPTVQSWWRGELAVRRSTSPGALRLLAVRLRGRGAVDETNDIAEEAARRHARLGDLLRERGRTRAAAIEYGAAARKAPGDPIVANRLARALLDTGQAGLVAEALRQPTLLYPAFPASHVHLGSAHAALGHEGPAITAFEEAIRLSPFDPEPHCALASLYADDDRRVRREEEACLLLR